MMFTDLTGRELAIVEKAGVLKSFTMNTPIINEGETGSSFFFIVSGRVEIRKRLEKGEFRTLVELGPAEMFGEIGFLGEEKRTASVVVTEDCHVLEFQRESMMSLLSFHSEIAAKLYYGMARELAQRLAKSDEALRDAIVWSMGTKAGAQES
ncbi:MAG: cyclic nucleotide-binding domain-containing protein [bacterium]